ncbi:Dysbindin Biogenesis of lysosome-related organelles complex 1 subunit 8 [Triplophysa tibetana]|uniref:Dysbindin Biogenesis of lysosome-related organelles complex 1 subunit 8 n=1 Tax=Triplophysa tibetana TaxID=1572043 RepID=A0A5A9NHG0_9TELE|nr:Dysbindin Biogenesis of lysosome-related organelles complex 1 subunit 8 [Triplophysa tibetana]
MSSKGTNIPNRRMSFPVVYKLPSNSFIWKVHFLCTVLKSLLDVEDWFLSALYAVTLPKSLYRVSLADTDHAQRVPDTDQSQQMRLRERQRFFEEVFQHDVYLSSAHLQIDYKRPPLGSISSMEVNVDMLEQMDLLDISDQEVLDVFFSASEEETALTSSLPAFSQSDVEDDFHRNITPSGIPDSCEFKARMLSTSSNSTCDSQASNEDGSNTPVIQSDDEDLHEDHFLQTGTPTGKDATSDQPGHSI